MFKELEYIDPNEEYEQLRKRYWAYNNGDDSKKLTETEWSRYQELSIIRLSALYAGQ